MTPHDHGIGDDGGSVMDCQIYSYALGLLNHTDSPTVIKICTLDGARHCYCAAYTGNTEIDKAAHDDERSIRVAVAVGCLFRAEEEIQAINDDPEHPARA